MLERESDPAKWKTVSPDDGADYLIHQAPVDELLTKFHLRLSDPGKPEA